MELESKVELEVVSVTNEQPAWCTDKWNLIDRMQSIDPKMEFLSLSRQIVSQELVEVWETGNGRPSELKAEQDIILLMLSQILRLVCSMDLDSQPPKEESEVISLIKQIISLFNSKPDSEEELLSLITQMMGLDVLSDSDSDSDSDSEPKLSELLLWLRGVVPFHSFPNFTYLIKDIISCLKSFNWEPKPLISLCPQAVVGLRHGRLFVIADDLGQILMDREKCRLESLQFFESTQKQHFYCLDCKGEYHEEYDKAPVEVKHPLHPKHSLQLVRRRDGWDTRECYCCNEDIQRLFYYCQTCNYAMNIACVEKPPPLLSVDHFKWHEHTLALFPRHTFLTCDLCALTDSSSAFYVCPPCDFVVHQSCLSLPHVIRISRHPHRIYFTPSFNKGDWLCGVCRKMINNSYGGYSCIKDNCSYAAHSTCATQSNVWDGIELEGQPEEMEQVVEPFVRITDAVIQHFSHQQHHLKLNENTGREYDENKLCQACVTPIYFGNFYSCVECDFILHEACANFPRRLYDEVIESSNEPNQLPTVQDGPMTRSKSKQLRKRFNTAIQAYISSLEPEDLSLSEPSVKQGHTDISKDSSIEEVDLSEEFSQLKLDQTPNKDPKGKSTLLAGHEDKKHPVNAPELVEQEVENESEKGKELEDEDLADFEDFREELQVKRQANNVRDPETSPKVFHAPTHRGKYFNYYIVLAGDPSFINS